MVLDGSKPHTDFLALSCGVGPSLSFVCTGPTHGPKATNKDFQPISAHDFMWGRSDIEFPSLNLRNVGTEKGEDLECALEWHMFIAETKFRPTGERAPHSIHKTGRVPSRKLDPRDGSVSTHPP